MDDLLVQISSAIQSVRSQVRWKQGSGERHLAKRRARSHLPVEATLNDYEQIIHSVLTDTTAQIYLYRYDPEVYIAIVAIVEGQTWLAMFNLEGIMESAFVVERPDRYLSRSIFERIGTLDEVLS